MQPVHKIFVGYFSKNHTKKKAALYVLRLTSHAQTISVHATPCGVSGKVYYCCLGFPKQSHADRAIKALHKKRYHGMQLLTRSWIERTAANERRENNWREHDWEGPERRKQERRHYHHLQVLSQPGTGAAASADAAKALDNLQPPSDHSSYLASEVMAAKEKAGQTSMPESELSDSTIVIREKF